MCAEDALAKVEIEGAGLTVSRYLVRDPDRHGTPRYYFRRKGEKKVRIRAEPGTAAFLAEFRAACDGRHQDQAASGAVPRGAIAAIRKNPAAGSLAWLFNEYEARSQIFRGLGDTTKARRRVVMDQICAETASTADQTPVGTLPFAKLRPKAISVIIHRCQTPATVNARLKAFREALKFAVAEDWITTNPAKEVTYASSASGGFYTWTVDDVLQFERRWPAGTLQHLALTMLLYTGVRRSDVVSLGKQHRKTVRVLVESGPDKGTHQHVVGLQFNQFKGRARKVKTTWLPVLAPLQDAIDARPSKGLTFLETSFGKPFSAKGFGTQFKKWCRKAGLPQCSAHGLRKAAATILAERGATPHQLMAIFGWDSMGQALVYTKAVEQKRLAAATMHKLVGPTDSTKSVPPKTRKCLTKSFT